MKIFVVGDIGYDNYLVGRVRGISAEAPIPIVDIQGPTLLPGMGLNVLANLHQLGATHAEVIIPEAPHYPIKSRLMVDGQQIARFDFEDWCTPLQRADLLPLLDADAVVVSDYGKGAIGDDVASILGQVTVPLFIDTKGDPAKYTQHHTWDNAFFFPNQQEYEKYRLKYEWFPRVVLKQGPEGLSYVEYGKVSSTRPAWAKRVQSVNGAGDTVIAAFAVAYLSLKSSIQHCLDVASAAAANVVEQDFLSRTTTPEAVGERIAHEVPRAVYNQLPASNNSPHHRSPHAGAGAGLPYQTAQQQVDPGRGPFGGTPSVGRAGELDAVSALRAWADAQEDDTPTPGWGSEHGWGV